MTVRTADHEGGAGCNGIVPPGAKAACEGFARAGFAEGVQRDDNEIVGDLG